MICLSLAGWQLLLLPGAGGMRYRYRDTLILSLTLLYQRAKHTSLDVILILILMKGSGSRSRPGRGSPERDWRTATHAGDSSGPGSGGVTTS